MNLLYLLRILHVIPAYLYEVEMRISPASIVAEPRPPEYRGAREYKFFIGGCLHVHAIGRIPELVRAFGSLLLRSGLASRKSTMTIRNCDTVLLWFARTVTLEIRRLPSLKMLASAKVLK